MNEPEYVYIKGQGWVVQPAVKTVRALTRDGVGVTIYDRPALKGEAHVYLRKEDGSVDMEQLIRHISNFGSRDWDLNAKRDWTNWGDPQKSIGLVLDEH